MRHPGREPLKYIRKILLLFEAFWEGKMCLKRFGQTEVQTNRGSDKQRFGLIEICVLKFLFLEYWQYYIFSFISGSIGVHTYAWL